MTASTAMDDTNAGPKVTLAMKRHFRDEFREARANVLADAESFDSVLFAIERLGSAITKSNGGMAAYRDVVARRLFEGDERVEFVRTFEIVRKARNSALHQGAVARNLAQSCVELALMIECQLAKGFEVVADFMATNPVCAAPWQLLSEVRRAMLAGSFSYLPYVDDEGALIATISDAALMRYLRDHEGSVVKARLTHTVNDAMTSTPSLATTTPMVVAPDTSIGSLLDVMTDHVPAIVVRSGRVVGIVTPFDVL